MSSSHVFYLLFTFIRCFFTLSFVKRRKAPGQEKIKNENKKENWRKRAPQHFWIISGPDTSVCISLSVCVYAKPSAIKRKRARTHTHIQSDFNRQFGMANIVSPTLACALRQIHTSINLYLHGYFCEFDIIYWSRYIFACLFYTQNK